VNLNRVYGNPSLSLHPTIYAARKLILYAHLGKDVEEDNLEPLLPPPSPIEKAESTPQLDAGETAVKSTTPFATSTSSLFFGQPPIGDGKYSFPAQSLWEIPTAAVRHNRPSASSRSSNASSRGSSLAGFPSLGISPHKQEYSSQWYEMTENSRCSEGDESIADFSLTGDHGTGPPVRSSLPNPEDVASYDFLPPCAVSSVSSAASQRTSFLGAFRGGPPTLPRLPDSFFQPASLKEIADSDAGGAIIDEDITSASDMMNQSKTDLGPTFPTDDGESGLYMYIDIHGHASKRGIFMYGNHFANAETKVDSLLFPRLMSVNCANFDFPACNFTEECQIYPKCINEY
jgi:hypothetical protein